METESLITRINRLYPVYSEYPQNDLYCSLCKISLKTMNFQQAKRHIESNRHQREKTLIDKRKNEFTEMIVNLF